MNLLLRYGLGFDLWYYILLSFAIVGVSVSGTITYNVRSSSVFMPVITRSQAKLSTDSSKELSGKVSSNSSKEFLEPLSNLASTSSQSSILETSSLPLCAKNTTIYHRRLRFQHPLWYMIIVPFLRHCYFKIQIWNIKIWNFQM